MQRYTNSYSDQIYWTVSSPVSNVNEIQVRRVGNKLQIVTTDGYNFFDDITCSNVIQAVRIIKAMFNKLQITN